MKFFCIIKGHIGIVEKVQETSSNTGMHNRAITVLHEQNMCVGKQRHTHSWISISILTPYSPSPQASNQLKLRLSKTSKVSTCMYKNVHNLHENIAKLLPAVGVFLLPIFSVHVAQ